MSAHRWPHRYRFRDDGFIVKIQSLMTKNLDGRLTILRLLESFLAAYLRATDRHTISRVPTSGQSDSFTMVCRHDRRFGALCHDNTSTRIEEYLKDTHLMMVCWLFVYIPRNMGSSG